MPHYLLVGGIDIPDGQYLRSLGLPYHRVTYAFHCVLLELLSKVCVCVSFALPRMSTDSALAGHLKRSPAAEGSECRLARASYACALGHQEYRIYLYIYLLCCLRKSPVHKIWYTTHSKAIFFLENNRAIFGHSYVDWAKGERIGVITSAYSVTCNFTDTFSPVPVSMSCLFLTGV